MIPLEECEEKMKECLRKYRAVKRMSKTERQQWMTELAKAKENEMKQAIKRSKTLKRRRNKKNPKYMASILKTILSNERMRDIFRRVQYAVGKQRLRDITAVEAQNEEGNWEQVTDQKLITKALVQEYKTKYHQTEDTPPMNQPMVSQIGYLGLGHQTDEILAGRMKRQPGSNRYANMLLTKLKRLDNQLIHPGITRDEYQEGWAKAKERTSSGGAILHFGHCKSMAQDQGMATLDAMFLSSAMKSGYAYSSW